MSKEWLNSGGVSAQEMRTGRGVQRSSALSVDDGPALAPCYVESLPEYHAGLSADSVKERFGLERVIKLASNESPLGPSPRAVAAFCAAATTAHRYPDPSVTQLREVLAAEHNVGAAQVICGHGSSELIDLICRTFASPVDHSVIGTPSFSCYRIYLQAANIPMTEVPLRGMTHFSAADLLAAVRPETRLVFLVNPNNPTGTVLAAEELELLVRELPPQVLLVVDEAYYEFVSQSDYPSALRFLGDRERLLTLRTFSKAHGMAAMRVGYAIGNEKLLALMHRVRLPFNMTGPSAQAAMASIADRKHLEHAVGLAVRERSRVVAQLRADGHQVIDSEANFFLMRFQEDATPIYEKLLRSGIIVRHFGGALSPCLRVTLGLEEENDAFLATLHSILVP